MYDYHNHEKSKKSKAVDRTWPLKQQPSKSDNIETRKIYTYILPDQQGSIHRTWMLCRIHTIARNIIFLFSSSLFLKQQQTRTPILLKKKQNKTKIQLLFIIKQNKNQKPCFHYDFTFSFALVSVLILFSLDERRKNDSISQDSHGFSQGLRRRKPILSDRRLYNFLKASDM